MCRRSCLDLSGPKTSRSADVARRYLEVRDRLIPIGLDLRERACSMRAAPGT